LRLTEEPAIQPLPIARDLPLLTNGARVYVIGYPAGGGLAFSMQDNALLDHEGPQAGTPPSPNVLRVHYRAPTEKGSSGSPVFNRSSWQVIALHHAGGELPKLNGKPGTHPANEGIALMSIIEAIKGAKVQT
jgi:V8-like Glu-specific endopeptidase